MHSVSRLTDAGPLPVAGGPGHQAERAQDKVLHCSLHMLSPLAGADYAAASPPDNAAGSAILAAGASGGKPLHLDQSNVRRRDAAEARRRQSNSQIEQ